MDTYADDLAALLEKLDLRNAIHVGHSTGGGEVARYIGRHGTKRVAKAVLISAVPPLMLKTDKNPAGTPLSVFDGLEDGAGGKPAAVLLGHHAAVLRIQPAWTRRFQKGSGSHWFYQGMLGGMKAHYDCIKAFSETDFTEDLKKFDVPTLILHGDDDQIVPIGAAGLHVGEDREECRAEGVSGLSARDVHHARGRDQRRAAWILQEGRAGGCLAAATGRASGGRRGRRPSDAGVPGVAGFGRRGAEAFAEFLDVIGYGQVGDVLDALVAELAGDAHAQRAAEADGEIAVVHAPGEEGLGMEGVGHVDAVPPVGFDGAVDDVAGLGQDADGVEDFARGVPIHSAM